MRYRTLSGIVGAIVVSLAGAAHADSWKTSGYIYGQFASMSGETTIGSNTADLDVSFSELLDHLDIAGMMALRSERDNWALGVNAEFTGLDGDVRDATGTLYDVEITQDLVELTWSWRFDEQYEVFAGARYQSLSTEITATGADGARTEDFNTESLTDPIIGARAAWPLGVSWTLVGRADIGGFGIGSDLTWSALAALDWSVSPSIGVVFGYRALDTDYENGSGDGLFKFDMLVAGPLIGMRFNFGAQ